MKIESSFAVTTALVEHEEGKALSEFVQSEMQAEAHALGCVLAGEVETSLDDGFEDYRRRQLVRVTAKVEVTQVEFAAGEESRIIGDVLEDYVLRRHGI